MHTHGQSLRIDDGSGGGCTQQPFFLFEAAAVCCSSSCSLALQCAECLHAQRILMTSPGTSMWGWMRLSMSDPVDRAQSPRMSGSKHVHQFIVFHRESALENTVWRTLSLFSRGGSLLLLFMLTAALLMTSSRTEDGDARLLAQSVQHCTHVRPDGNVRLRDQTNKQPCHAYSPASTSYVAVVVLLLFVCLFVCLVGWLCVCCC